MDLNVKTCRRFLIFYKVIEPWKCGQGKMTYDWSANSYHELSAKIGQTDSGK